MALMHGPGHVHAERDLLSDVRCFGTRTEGPPCPHSVARRAADREVRVIALRPEVAEVLRRPVTGTGGFQTLFRRMQAGLRGCILRVDSGTSTAWSRSPRDGGRLGGYQGRAEAVSPACSIGTPSSSLAG
jgi:hypothetical protein